MGIRDREKELDPAAATELEDPRAAPIGGADVNGGIVPQGVAPEREHPARDEPGQPRPAPGEESADAFKRRTDLRPAPDAPGGDEHP